MLSQVPDAVFAEHRDLDSHGRFLLVQRNLVRGILTSPKSHRCRRVDVSAQLAGALQDWRRVQQARWLKKGTAFPVWIFPSSEGTCLDDRNVRLAFSRMLTKAKLRHIRIHDLRQHAGSRIMPG